MVRAAVDLLAQPHHDTGPAHLLGRREPGAVLTARLWVPAPRDPGQVVLRQVVDGEPTVTVMDRVHTTAAGSWWEGAVRLVNPVNRYRFLLLEPDGVEPYTWYHAAGTSDHDVPDATDFRVLAHDAAPDWVLDAVCYQIFPDRFSSHTPPDLKERPPWAEPRGWDDEPPRGGEASGRAWYGGDLDGIVDRLDHLESLGVDTVYLTPVFPAGSVHRYDSTTFEDVDPVLGGVEALSRLATALHERGMRLILDLTTNHTGAEHEWFRTAVKDADSPEAGYYAFTHHPDRYACWFDVPSLPRLNHRDERLRDLLVRGYDSITARWLLPPVEADGWRTDVANMTGRIGQVDLAHRVAADMRATMGEVEQLTGRSLWLVAEHGHDASADLTGPGWHGTMNYTGFMRPLWAWLADPDPADGITWLGIPTAPPRLGGDAVVRGLREYTSQMPASSLARSMNLLDSHDTPRIRTVVGSREAHLVAATALFTAPGVPTIFSGDELGATGLTGEHSRTTMPWASGPVAAGPSELAESGSWGPVDCTVLARYRRLSGLRRSSAALRRGGLRWVHSGDDLVVWVRTHPDGDVMVALARDAAPALEVPLGALHARGLRTAETFDGVGALTAPGADGETVLRLEAHGPGSAVVHLAPERSDTRGDDHRAATPHPC